MTAPRGSALIDALTAAMVAGLGLTVLARAAHITATTLGVTADTTALLDLASAQLERLRRWPAPDGTDTIRHLDGNTYRLTWSSLAGRGQPRQLAVTATSANRSLTLTTQAFP